MQAKAYAFKSARDVVDLMQSLGQAGSELSLVMADRTAERELAFGKRVDSEVPLPLSAEGAELVRALHPLAPLGAPGSGLVGVGAALAYLHGVGLGSHRDLPASLTVCALAAEDVREVVEAVRQGGVLVIADREDGQSLTTRARELTLEFPATATPAPPPVRAPAAPSAEQHGQYTPAVIPADDASRNLENR
jgi:hypothetical protein